MFLVGVAGLETCGIRHPKPVRYPGCSTLLNGFPLSCAAIPELASRSNLEPFPKWIFVTSPANDIMKPLRRLGE
jgi:hypothetical protein